MEFHDVANLFPLIEGQEFNDLVEDICINGLQQTIWTYQGKIVDGRNRYRACNKAGVAPRFQEWHGQGSLVKFVISLNVKRRHLTSSQLAVIALDVLEKLEEEAKERQRLAGGDKKSESAKSLPQNSGEAIGSGSESVKEAAKLLNTNHDYVSAAKKVAAAQIPSLLEHVKDGTLSVMDAKAIVNQPEDRRDAVLERALQIKKEEEVRGSKAVKEAIFEEEIKEKIEKKEEEAKKLTELERQLANIEPSRKGVQTGQWWKLGNHWLYCGDSSSQVFIQKVEESKPSFAFADPPYNAEVDTWDSGFVWRHDYLMQIAPIVAVTPGISAIKDFMRSTDMPYKWSLSYWISNGMARGALGFGNWIYVALFTKGSLHRNAQDLQRISVPDFDVSIPRGDHDIRIQHKGKKPLAMMKHIVELFTKSGETVVDPFLGSGTTLITCQEDGRVCIGAEQEVEFCEGIIHSWEKISGQQAEKSTDGIYPVLARAV